MWCRVVCATMIHISASKLHQERLANVHWNGADADQPSPWVRRCTAYPCCPAQAQAHSRLYYTRQLNTLSPQLICLQPSACADRGSRGLCANCLRFQCLRVPHDVLWEALRCAEDYHWSALAFRECSAWGCWL